MASPIPIKNIYYLLAYAWNRLPESEIVDVSTVDSHELADLFAAVLVNGIHHLLRRGLDQSYLAKQEELAGIRGRINIGVTARRMLAPHGRAYCEFDELQVDTLPNQILRASVNQLIGVPSLDKKLRMKLRGLNRELGGISEVPLSRSMFRSVQLHSNNRFYRFLLSICELILTMSLVDKGRGDFRFRDFVRDDKSMARLFESFVFNFYRLERPDLDIRKERIYWRASSANDPELRFLPTMETDISVRDKPHTQTLIIDTKFYKETFQRFYDTEKLHSSNLYQLLTYLNNLNYREGADSEAQGMLLYPVVEKSARLSYQLTGREIRICTVNLAADWREIRSELHSLLSF
jgi:5-methylcytosine-specific restriction enzyme subunit McrC